MALLYLGGCLGKLPVDGDEQDREDSGASDTAGTEDSDTADTAETGGGDTGGLIPGEEITDHMTIGVESPLFGWALDEGDIDGDGRDDLLVGAPGVERDGEATVPVTGEAWLFYGPILPDSHPRSIVFSGITPGDALGTSLAHGDFNHDGVNDVAVGGGMPTAANPNAAGFVSVVYGPFTGDVALSRSTMLSQDGAADAFGAALVVSDLTGDGFDDLVVGVPQADTAESPDVSSSRGLVKIYLGSSGGLANDGVAMVMIGDTDGGRFGEALARGDSNGDGIDDLLVGAPQEGAAYLYHGPFDDPEGYLLTSDAETVFRGAESGDQTGASVDLDDIDGDDIADIIIGAPGSDEGGLDAGAVEVLYSSGAANATLIGEQPGSLAGTSVAFANDVNNDGSYDLVVGAPKYDEEDALDAGRAYLVLGPIVDTHWLGASDHVTGYLPNMRLGQSVLGDTELTGDSLADVVFGGPNVTTPEASMGGIIKLMAGY